MPQNFLTLTESARGENPKLPQYLDQIKYINMYIFTNTCHQVNPTERHIRPRIINRMVFAKQKSENRTGKAE